MGQGKHFTCMKLQFPRDFFSPYIYVYIFSHKLVYVHLSLSYDYFTVIVGTQLHRSGSLCCVAPALVIIDITQTRYIIAHRNTHKRIEYVL